LESEAEQHSHRLAWGSKLSAKFQDAGMRVYSCAVGHNEAFFRFIAVHRAYWRMHLVRMIQPVASKILQRQERKTAL
jgi:hypothetical protein